MKKKLKLILSGIALLSTTAYAEYQSGFYAGANVGGSYGSNKVREVDSDGDLLTEGRRNAGAIDGGLHLGYLWCCPESNWVLAIEHESDFSSFSKKWSESITGGNEKLDNKLTRLYAASFIAKVGCIWDEIWFPYVLAGLSLSHYKLNVNVTDTASHATASASISRFMPGFVYGIGLERQLDDNWRIGVELKGTHYMQKTLSVNVPTWGQDDAKLKSDVFYAWLRLSYAF